MAPLLDNTLYVFAFSLITLSFSAWVGGLLGKRAQQASRETRDAFGIIQAATLTLLGLIIAFTFSMALNRYDQRKNLEEEEANAIGTEYFRAGLLEPTVAEKVRKLLREYLDQRIRFYTHQDVSQLGDINAQTGELQARLWATIEPAVAAQPTQISALVASGMNDVLNTQGYTQAAWWNRIPLAAWLLMAAIAVWANAMVGFGAVAAKAGPAMLFALPFALSITFGLIADIDGPTSGGIKVTPQNLLSLVHSLPGP